MILTLFPGCLKYLQLEGSMPAPHNHLCLCGPLQAVAFGSWEGFLFGWALTGAEGAFLGFGVFLPYFSLLCLLMEFSLCRIPLKCHRAEVLHRGDLWAGRFALQGLGDAPLQGIFCR